MFRQVKHLTQNTLAARLYRCLSLNLQGYVHEMSPIYVPSLAIYAEEGAVFDPNGWGSLVPVVGHTVVILMLNTLYREICEWLTEMENHRYVSEKESSIVLKRFLFEAFDCYIALFYIAFYELDVAKLRSELVSLYTVDSIRRVATESLLPFLIERYNEYQSSANVGKAKKDDDFKAFIASAPMKARLKDGNTFVFEDDFLSEAKAQDDPAQLEYAVAEVLRDEHEAFDEYLEMVIELGQYRVCYFIYT